MVFDYNCGYMKVIETGEEMNIIFRSIMAIKFS